MSAPLSKAERDLLSDHTDSWFLSTKDIDTIDAELFAAVQQIVDQRVREVREQIAGEIEALMTPEDAVDRVKQACYQVDAAYYLAAAIARGVQ